MALGIPTPSGQPLDVVSLRDNGLWSPEVPPAHYLLNGSEDGFPLERDMNASLPFSTVIFGGVNGQDLSQLVEIVGWVFDVFIIVGLQFLYADASKNKSLGQIGPFPADASGRMSNMSEDFRMPFSINGPGGEVVSGITVQGSRHGNLYGLKVVSFLVLTFKLRQTNWGYQDRNQFWTTAPAST